MIDTCQANTLYKHFYSPNIIATGSSALDQSSYSHHADNDVGVAVIDRWTYYNLEFLETQVTSPTSKLTLGDLFDSYDESKIHSQPGLRWDLFPGGEDEGRRRTVMDFFGNVQNVEVEGDEEEGWREDMVQLARMIAEWKATAAEMEGRRANATADATVSVGDEAAEKKTVQVRQHSIGAAKVQAESGWKKKATGLGVVSGLGLAWMASSWLSASASAS